MMVPEKEMDTETEKTAALFWLRNVYICRAGMTPAGQTTKRGIIMKNAKNLEIYIQSPLGGNITPEEIRARLPQGTESCYVRVDQNLIWWVRGDETGAIEIWSDDR